jgi:hypothetical protein
VQDRSLIVLANELLLYDVHVMLLDQSELFVRDNVKLYANATLQLSTVGVRIVSVTAEQISSWLVSGNGNSSYLLLNHTVPAAYVNDSLSYIDISALHIAKLGKLQFLSTYVTGWDNSNVIAADSLTIAAGGMIDATAVLQSPKLDFDYAASTAATYRYFGYHADKKFAASGGGHVSAGLPGSNSQAAPFATASNRRGDVLYPLGPGGAGGGDVSKHI